MQKREGSPTAPVLWGSADSRPPYPLKPQPAPSEHCPTPSSASCAQPKKPEPHFKELWDEYSAPSCCCPPLGPPTPSPVPPWSRCAQSRRVACDLKNPIYIYITQHHYIYMSIVHEEGPSPGRLQAPSPPVAGVASNSHSLY
jgi:hypothetical protein